MTKNKPPWDRSSNANRMVRGRGAKQPDWVGWTHSIRVAGRPLSALCRRWLKTRCMGEDAPKPPFIGHLGGERECEKRTFGCLPPSQSGNLVPDQGNDVQPSISHLRVSVGDQGGRQVKDALGGMVAGGGDHRRHKQWHQVAPRQFGNSLTGPQRKATSSCRRRRAEVREADLPQGPSESAVIAGVKCRSCRRDRRPSNKKRRQSLAIRDRCRRGPRACDADWRLHQRG